MQHYLKQAGSGYYGLNNICRRRRRLYIKMHLIHQ